MDPNLYQPKKLDTDQWMEAAFAALGVKMTEELVSRYGPLCEIWYDAGLPHPRDGGPDVLPVIDRHQKNTVFYHSPQRRDHRWIGNESGFAGEPCWSTMPDLEAADRAHRQSREYKDLLLHGDPEGKLWSPGMVDVPIRNHEWFWRPGDDSKLYKSDDLVKMYYQSVGRNCTFIAGAVPDVDGLIPDADMRLYAEFGKEVRRRFGRPLGEAKGGGVQIEVRLPGAARFDHVVVKEDILRGERVREYVVEVLAQGGQWRQIAAGQSIGHKWIHRFSPVESPRVRLRVTKFTAQPQIRSLAVFSTA